MWSALYIEDYYFTYVFTLSLKLKKSIYQIFRFMLKIYYLHVKYHCNHFNALSSICCKLKTRTIHHWQTQWVLVFITQSVWGCYFSDISLLRWSSTTVVCCDLMVVYCNPAVGNIHLTIFVIFYGYYQGIYITYGNFNCRTLFFIIWFMHMGSFI